MRSTDVLGSAKGWAASFLFHPYAKAQLDQFYRRENTFSLGVCNGCQLLALLQWVGNTNPKQSGIRMKDGDIPSTPEVFLDHNSSERYESRFPSVKIEKTSSIMLKGMADDVLGVWVAHAEGTEHFFYNLRMGFIMTFGHQVVLSISLQQCLQRWSDRIASPCDT